MDCQEVADEIKEMKEVLAKVKQDQFPELHHPGTIYHIVNTEGVGLGEQKQRVYLSRSKIFTESILLLENMIVDHLHTSYEDFLKTLPSKI